MDNATVKYIFMALVLPWGIYDQSLCRMPNARRCCRIRRTQGDAQRQLQARPLHRRDDRDSSVAEGEDPRSEGVDQDASRPAVIAMSESAFTAEPVSPGAYAVPFERITAAVV